MAVRHAVRRWLGRLGHSQYRNLGPARGSFDPYPYVFLNLILSMLAAIQAPIIVMSQNRQATRDRLDAEQDHQVNVQAEIMVRNLDFHLHRLE